MIFDGRNGGTVELLDNVLVIRRKGVASFLTQGIKGEKRIPYASITTVQFKEAGFTTGYIQFGVAGGIESRRGVWDATTDENTVLFTKEASRDFHRLRDIVEERAATGRMGGSASTIVPNANISEELTRLADLRDRGVLTEEEFAHQKASLLGKKANARSEGPSPEDYGTGQSNATNLRSTTNASQTGPMEKPKSRLGKALGIGCLGLIGIIIVLTAIGSEVEQQNKSANASNPADVDLAAGEGATEPLKVSAVQLARAYDSNEARAQQAYGDQQLLVTGTVAGVDLDLTDDPVVQLATDNEFMPASAYLVNEDKPRASDLDKGQKVVLLCQSVSEVMSMPQLKDCAIK